MPSTRQSRKGNIYWLSLVTFIGFFLSNAGGFFDTATGSALGCGRDWPLCNGRLIPDAWNFHTVVEYGHRAIVLLSILFLIPLCIVAWRKYGKIRDVRLLLSASLVGVFLESMFGMLAVQFVNPPWVMALHMGIALISIAGLFLLTMVIHQIEHAEAGTSLRRVLPIHSFAKWPWITLVYVYVAIYVGAYVASTGAGDFFKGFPFPTEHYNVAGFAFLLDIAHRGIALGMICLIAWLLIKTRQMRHVRRELYTASICCAIFVGMQAVSGGLLIASHLAPWAFLLHVTIVSCLFCTVAFMAFQVLQGSTEVGLHERPARGKSYASTGVSKG